MGLADTIAGYSLFSVLKKQPLNVMIAGYFKHCCKPSASNTSSSKLDVGTFRPNQYKLLCPPSTPSESDTQIQIYSLVIQKYRHLWFVGFMRRKGGGKFPSLLLLNLFRRNWNIHSDLFFPRPCLDCKFFHSLSITSNLWTMHGVLNVDKKTNYTVWL